MPDVTQIVRTAIEREMSATRHSQDYTYEYDTTERELDGGGKVKSTKHTTFEVSVLYGKQFRRLIARDGKPLPADEDAKVRKKFDADVAQRASMSEQERAQELRKQREQRAKDIEFMRQIPDIFDLKLKGTEQVNGREAYVVEATPKAGAKPKGRMAGAIARVGGTMWIDKADSRWSRVHVNVLEPVRFGWFLVSLAPQSTISVEQTRVSDDLWMPLRINARIKARFTVKTFRVEIDSLYSKYRKFSVDSRVLPASTSQ
jgi:hypothetical protein